MPADRRFRVFISYSHEDREIFLAVTRALESVGLRPWSDKNLAAGVGFTEQIQTYITHSHLFVPVLTDRSHRRGWVHQEIGYAVAMRVPYVPICVGKLPTGMIAMAHAVRVNEQLTDLDMQLQVLNLPLRVREAAEQWLPPGECAQEPEDRARLLTRYANEAGRVVRHSVVRSLGGLSSFSVPDAPSDDRIWALCYGDRPRTKGAYALFREEHRALASHARKAGLKLVVDDSLDLDAQYGIGVKRSRLECLAQFLEGLPPGKAQVTFQAPDRDDARLFLAVGDWFTAESRAMKPVRGVTQTIFTSHAPSVTRQVEDFDERFERLLEAANMRPGNSLSLAVARLHKLAAKLPRRHSRKPTL